MKNQAHIEEFLCNLAQSVIVDVRTPSEYTQGHIKNAINIPLFSDQERAEVGTLYVRTSKEAAIERGLEIVGPKMADIVRTTRKLTQNNSKLLKIYCWRGGMRSESVQWLLETASIKTIRLKGGYKAYRTNFERLLDLPWKFQILSGYTGCGKTEILEYLSSQGHQILNLEELAHHKGSAFGSLGQLAQPTTEEFINKIHEILRSFDITKPIWVESESITIGHVFIPPKLFAQLISAPIIQLNLPEEVRLKRIIHEYGHYTLENLAQSFEKISKRIGYDNYKIAIEALAQGNISQAAAIALKYYDKCYANSIQKRTPQSLSTYNAINDNVIENANKILELCKS